MVDIIKNTLIEASKAYSDQTIIRAGINTIPFVGGSIDILLSSTGQNFVIKRIENFIAELDREISTLNESKINYDFFQSEEGFDLIIKAFNSVSKTRQQEKLILYARIIKGTITLDKSFEVDDPEIYLNIVEELSVKELKVARFLYELKEINVLTEQEIAEAEIDKKKNGHSINDAGILSNRYTDLNKDDLISVFIRLERTGLIKEVVGSYMGYTGGKYLINPLFKKFMAFIDTLDYEIKS